MDSSALALVLVDIQRDFWQPLKQLPAFAGFDASIRSLLQGARQRGLLIVHLHSEFQGNGSDWMLFYRGLGRIPCILDSQGALFEEFAKPLAGELVIAKKTFDGFVGTPLEQTLRNCGVKAILVAGLETSVCVLFTAASAYMRRFVPIVVKDACADLEKRHKATLCHYTELCFQTVTTAEVNDDFQAVLQLAGRFAEDQPQV